MKRERDNTQLETTTAVRLETPELAKDPQQRNDNTNANNNDVLNSNEKPSKKRKLQFGQSLNIQGDQNTRIFEHFRKLDTSNPTEAKRIETRHKQILKGKNTVGYDIYIKKVPKHKRKKIIEHPSTPDYKADIPNRRWLGLLKAWRKSLHQYDPLDLGSSLDSNDTKQKSDTSGSAVKTTSLQPRPENVKERQIHEAEMRGLLVDFAEGTTNESMETPQSVDPMHNVYNDFYSQQEGETQDSGEVSSKAGDELDKWENERLNACDDDLLLDYDDSDDDLL